MYNCIIVDDEPGAIRVLQSHLAETGLLHLVHATTNPAEALRIINEQSIDIAFIDVRMPGISGIELAAAIKGKCKVILTTAHSKYVSEAFDKEVDLADYLIKPILLSRFVRAVDRTIKSLDLLRAQQISTVNAGLENQPILVRTFPKGDRIALMLKDIDYIRAMRKQVIIYHGGRATTAQSGMGEIEKKLPANQFLQIHKSYIIALDKIERIEGQSVILKNHAHSIPIGDMFRNAFTEATKGRVV